MRADHLLMVMKDERVAGLSVGGRLISSDKEGIAPSDIVWRGAFANHGGERPALRVAGSELSTSEPSYG
jgi:hypothetical protein